MGRILSAAVGSRVNCVVVRDGMWSLYGLGGGWGDGFDYLFAPGPSATLRWLDSLADDYLTDEWFDDLFCEGGVLVDVDDKVLLIFTRLNYVEVAHRYAFRAAMLDAYRRTWDGWQVRWAYDGVGDLLDYVGEDRGIARYDGLRFDQIYPYGWEESDPTGFLVTVVDKAVEARAYGLTGEAYEPWLLGPPLLDQLRHCEPLTTCRSIPMAGLHLDLATRGAGLWSIQPLAGILAAWTELWPGWSLQFWEDDYGQQVSRNPGLTVPAVDLAPRLAELAKRVVSFSNTDDRARLAQKIKGT